MGNTIVINGQELTRGQTMALRLALDCFHDSMCEDDNILGDDEHGRVMTKSYRNRSNEILNLFEDRCDG